MVKLPKTFKTAALILLLVLPVALSACSADNGVAQEGGSSGGAAVADSSPGASSAEESETGGELSYALASSPDSLDPHRSGLSVSSRVIRTMFDNLVIQLPDHTIQPWLATEWTESEDGLSYIFKLRQDVKFHDGTPFNAEAVKFNFDRVIDPNTKGVSAIALLSPYESSEVIDEYTIKLTLSKPSRAFLGNLSAAQLSIVSPTAAAQFGDRFGQHPVGTGPFKFVKWEDNSEIKVERNPDYNWAPALVDNKGSAYLDGIIFKIVPEDATRIGSVQSGQALAAESVPPQNVAALKSDPKFKLLQANTLGLPYTLFINQNREPWNELQARQALQYGIDAGTIVKTLYQGTYEQAWSALTPGMFGYDASLENSIKPDADKANSLLEQLGWIKGPDGIRQKDGKRLTLRYVVTSPNREKRNDIAVIVQQQLKKIGIEVEVVVTKDIRTEIFVNDNYDVFGNSDVSGDPSWLSVYYHTAPKGAIGNMSHVSDPELDRWLEQGAVEKDDVRRAELYRNVQQYIRDNAVMVPIYVFPYTVATSKSVENLKFDPLGFPLFNDVRLTK